jgi:hypothetical protein
MRQFMIPIVLIAGLGLAPAFAATTPSSNAAPATHATQTSAPVQEKKAACEKSWATEAHHNGTKGAFLKACIAKG